MEEERTPPPQREDEKRKRRTTSGGSPSKGRQGEREGQEETEDLTVVSGYTAGSPYLTNPPAYENPISDPPAHVNPISDPPAYVNPISDPPAYVNPISDPPAYETPISLHSTGSSVSPLLGHASTSRDLSGHSPLKKRCKYTSPSGITTSKPGPSSSGYQGQSVLSVTLDDVRNRIRSGGDETSSIAENLLRECAIGTLTPPKNPPPNPFDSPRRKKARSGTPSKASRSPLAHSPKPDSTRSSDTAGAVSRAKKASSHKRPEFLNLPNPLSTELSSEMPPTAEIEMSSIPMASAEPRHTTIQHPPTMFAEEQELSRVLPSTSELLEGNLSGEGDHNLSPSNQSESRMPNLSPRDQFSSKFTPSPERQPSENSELLGIADNMHRCYDCADYYSRSSCNKCLRRLYRSIHERPVSPSIPGPSRSELSPERRSNLRPLYISPQSNREMTSHFGSPGTPENYFKPDACGLLRSPNKCCACIGYSLQGETPWLNPIISSSSTEHQTDTSPNKSGSSLSDTFPTKSKSPDSDSISLKPCRICFQKYIEKLHPLPIGDFGDICNICKHCFKTCKRRVPKAEKRKASHLSPRKLDYIRSIFPFLFIRSRLSYDVTPEEKHKRSPLTPLKELFSFYKKKKRSSDDREDLNRSWEGSSTTSRRLFERNLEASAAGASLGAAGASYGAAGTSYGAAGTSYGAAGTSLGAAGTSLGAAGTSLGAAGTSYGAPGTSYGAAGTSYGAAGTSYGAAGTSYGAAGTSYGAAGTSYGAAGTSYGAAGTSYGAAGTSLGAANVGGYSVGLPGVYVLPHTGTYFPGSDISSSPSAKKSLVPYFSRMQSMQPEASLPIPREHPPLHAAQHPPLHAAQHPPLHAAQHPPLHAAQHPPLHAAQHPPLHAAQHPPLHAAQHPPLHAAQHPPNPEVQSPQRTKDKSESFIRKLGFGSRNKKDKK